MDNSDLQFIQHLLDEVTRGQLWAVKTLIDEGLDVITEDVDGNTALHLAAMYGHIHIVDMLLRADTCLYVYNKHKQLPLHLAAQHGHLDIVKALIGAGCDVNIQDKSGQTALHLATQHNNVFIVKALVEAEANVHIQDKNGHLPLSLAIDFDVVFVLVYAGANLIPMIETRNLPAKRQRTI